jgi:hypothetical protein
MKTFCFLKDVFDTEMDTQNDVVIKSEPGEMLALNNTNIEARTYSTINVDKVTNENLISQEVNSARNETIGKKTT